MQRVFSLKRRKEDMSSRESGTCGHATRSITKGVEKESSTDGD